MRSEIFQHEVTKTSALFGRAKGVRVVFHGERAATDGSTVYLPQLRMGMDIGLEEQRVMRGFVDHEAGHLRHSDMKLLMKKYKQYAAEGRALAKGLSNALEDMWLEARVMRDYPGSRENLRAVADAVNTRTLERLGVREGKAAPERYGDACYITPVALTWQGRLGYGVPSNEELLDLLPEKVRKPLKGWVERALACKDSGEILKLAEEIERLLKDERRKEREESGEGTKTAVLRDAEDGEEGEGADGEAVDLDDFDEVRDERKGKRSDEDGDEGKGEGDETETEDGDESAGEPDVFEDFDVADAVSERLGERELTGEAGSETYRPWTTRYDRVILPDSKGDRYERHLAMGRADGYERRKAGMAGEVGVMRRALERALVARQARDWTFGLEDGRLDGRRFAGAIAGKTNVFKRRSDRVEMDTAVSIVVDLSGSMMGGKDKVATDCAIAMAEALERTGVAFEVVGFSQPGGPKTCPEEGVYSRWEWLALWVFKPFEKRLVRCRAEMDRLESCVGGNNCDGESLLHAWSRLRVRAEQRKVMIVLSDGIPACYSCLPDWSAHLGAHLRGVIEHLVGEGCEMAGIGIKTKAVRQFYERAVVVEDVNELAKTGVQVLGDLLLGGKRHEDRSRLVKGIR